MSDTPHTDERYRELEAQRLSSLEAINAAKPGTGAMLEAVRKHNAAVLNPVWRDHRKKMQDML